MKKIFILIAALMVMGSAQANNGNATTSEQPEATASTTAVADDDDKDWEVSHPFKSDDEKKHWSLTASGIYVGVGISNSWDKVNNSIEAGMLNIVSLEYNTLHGQEFSLGVGVHHKSYSMKRPNMLVCDNTTHIVDIVPYPNGYEDKNRTSNLNLWSMQVPLMFRQSIYKKFGIKVGGIMNWNFKALASNHYEFTNIENNVTYKGLKQKKITFDFIGGLSFDSFGIYCRYSPSQFFEKGYGPEIKNTWTLGCAFGF